MNVQLVFVSFKFNISSAEYRQTINSLVSGILNAPGLRWKIWLINENECSAGGVYLFDDAASAELFLASPLMGQLTHHPAFADFHIMPFNVLESETAMTHGPIGKGVRV